VGGRQKGRRKNKESDIEKEVPPGRVWRGGILVKLNEDAFEPKPKKKKLGEINTSL